MMRLAALLLCLATPALADMPDRATLEEPGRIWIRETLQPSVEMGIVIPFLSYAQFEDGRFADVYASSVFVIGPDSCPDVITCEDSVKSAAIFEGKYDLTEDGLALTDITRSPLNFDRADFAVAVAADSFSRGEAAPLMSLDGDALLRMTPTGPVRYVPAKIDDVAEIFGLIQMVQSSIALNYECLVNGHLTRANADAPDQLSEALLALGKLGAIRNVNMDEKRRLLRGNTVTMFDLPEDEALIFEQVQLADAAISLITNDMQKTYATARADNDDAPLPDLDAALDAFPAGLLERIPAENRAAFKSVLAEQAAIARRALPALYAFETGPKNYGTPLALLCHGR